MENSREQIWESLKQLLKQKNPALKDLSPELGLFKDLHYDSLKTMELVIQIEKTFGIEIRGDDVHSHFTTLDGIVALILKRKNPR